MSAEGRILGVDYGSRRVGLALSDPLGIIASGIGTLPNDADLIPLLAKLVAEHAVTRIVVGLPLTLRGESGEAATMVRSFIERLNAVISVPVVTLDERFTSSIAEHAIREMGVGRKKRRDKAKVDEIAAIVLLQDYLSSGAHARPVP